MAKSIVIALIMSLLFSGILAGVLYWQDKNVMYTAIAFGVTFIFLFILYFALLRR